MNGYLISVGSILEHATITMLRQRRSYFSSSSLEFWPQAYTVTRQVGPLSEDRLGSDPPASPPQPGRLVVESHSEPRAARRRGSRSLLMIGFESCTLFVRCFCGQGHHILFIPKRDNPRLLTPGGFQALLPGHSRWSYNYSPRSI